jgi:hypothetical protein
MRTWVRRGMHAAAAFYADRKSAPIIWTKDARRSAALLTARTSLPSLQPELGAGDEAPILEGRIHASKHGGLGVPADHHTIGSAKADLASDLTFATDNVASRAARRLGLQRSPGDRGALVPVKAR